MKIIAIGDTHGRQNWKTALPSDLSDVKRIIFIGDYFDTHDSISQHQQIENFKDILAFKKANLEKVILLIGNHDYHYMGDFSITYSGFNSARAFDVRELLNKALKDGLIQTAYYEDIVLFTHAGVTKTWAGNNLEDYNKDNLAEKINELFLYKPKAFEFTTGEKYNMYGDEICQTPIWVRPNSLLNDPVNSDIVQVVGHTQRSKITTVDRCIFIDCLDKSPKEILTLTN